MARRFRGEFTQKVDSKGRVSIPAAYRRVLEENDPDWTEGLNPNFVLVYGNDARDFLEAYTGASITEVDDKIARLDRGTPTRRKMERIFSGQAINLTVNESGQIVLPAKVREKIGIDKEVYFTAAVDTFQIWVSEAAMESAGAVTDPLAELEAALREQERGD